jgi:hypothetical protein
VCALKKIDDAQCKACDVWKIMVHKSAHSNWAVRNAEMISHKK